MVADVDSGYQRLKRAGIDFREHPEDMPWRWRREVLVGAKEVPALSLPFHSHQQFLFESGRTVLRADYPEFRS
ncbi:MAG TPA: hypothetical protein VKV17_01385 [Bryobacteraceae bacterium]|nr:hypothetical protein [Bryobacteraceae bacterium]